MSFENIDFDKAFKDAESADLKNWEFFAESHGVKIYRLYCSVMFKLTFECLIVLKINLIA